MFRRSAALQSVAALFLGVLIVGRLTAAYPGDDQILVANNVYLSYSATYPVYQLDSGVHLVNVFSTPAPLVPQLEIIAMDRTGRPLNGIPDIYQPNYKEGHDIGYASGYGSGFATGQQRGTSEGTTNGRNDGYDKGWGETYQPAFDSAYDAHLPVGKVAGWNQGHVDGFADGYDYAPILAGSLTVTNNNRYGGGNWGSGAGIMAFSGSEFNSGFRYLSPDEVPAFYYKLGLDDGKKEGESTGSTDGYKVTYSGAYAAAFPIGYEDGTAKGTSQGTSDGKDQGFSAGWEIGYEPGFDSGFDAGVQHYFSQHTSTMHGTLEVSFSGYVIPAGPLSWGESPILFFDVAPAVGDATSDASVPEPTSMALLGIAMAAIMLRRTR
jgi:PEP-CTERM motif